MIDKNDVKMPVQRENIDELLKDEEKVRKIEGLLSLVGSTESDQKLRLKQDYYGRFNWFGFKNTTSDSVKKSYFSYQEEAVYDFIFNLNKSGILSDQVGMGKTIEAGMIISELASRNELRSLLIIVPNEIMAQKWEDELKHKFGIDEYTKMETVYDENGGVRHEKHEYPVIRALKSYDDFCRCVFDCKLKEKFYLLSKKLDPQGRADAAGFTHLDYQAKPNDTLESIIRSFVETDIKEAVNLINKGFDMDDNDPGAVKVTYDGSSFTLKNKETNITIVRKYEYDKSGSIKDYLKRNAYRATQGSLERMLNSRGGFHKNYEKMIKQEFNDLFTLVGDYFTGVPDEISSVSESMINNYPLLVIPIAYSEYGKDGVKLAEFLNRPLLSEMQDYKHQYMVQNEQEEIHKEFEEYRIVDFFIDVAYQTIIVDEVHDYIDVCAKMERKQFHATAGHIKFPSSDYNRYELFDDYYFIKKSSLYKKLKALADNANRKIFLTATPIKSDMVDFYLLTLLASNKDSEMYKRIRADLDIAFPMLQDREDAIEELYEAFKESVKMASMHFCRFSKYYFQPEEKVDGAVLEFGKYRFRFPYFHNYYLNGNSNRQNVIEQYLLGQLSYLSMEELVLELIISYMAEKSFENPSDTRDEDEAVDIVGIIDELCELLRVEEGNSPENYLQTRVVFRTLFNNSIKIRFEEDFTKLNEKGESVPIKRIRELLETEEGPRKWHKTYRKYGIRHTRHQTYNLENCDVLEKLRENKRERYKNLPLWPRRNGKVIFLVRDDIFFDCFQDVKRPRPNKKSEAIRIEELPNSENRGPLREEEKERFENAVAIFDYINNAMSGGDDVYHEPASSKYDSVEIDDTEMVDYKLALVSRLMSGGDQALGTVNRNVLLFAENDREAIVEWFGYIRYRYLLEKKDGVDGITSDEKNELDGYEETLEQSKIAEYKKKWERYGVDGNRVAERWYISQNAGVLDSSLAENLLIIIDPKRYEKGVDLQKADTIINFDINYCPLKMEQRIGRIDRIRPAGQSQEINIVSFVPLNDMSGYVINFFANELKMFTQWMGETTGIVSVPDEADLNNKQGEDVSFEGKVYKLEEYYNHVYALCKNDVPEEKRKSMVSDFRRFFGQDEIITDIDFNFIQKLRSSFDKAFRNSISPKREGYPVYEKDERVIRFNSTRGNLEGYCYALKCDQCQYKSTCKGEPSKVKNKYREFYDGVTKFFELSAQFYDAEHLKWMKNGVGGVIGGGTDRSSFVISLMERAKLFKKEKEEVMKLLPKVTDEPFTMEFDTYSEIFGKLKKLYWDDVVDKYIKMIIERFHKQCDSVLDGASLFERFIKTLSIADFMNNMEGSGNER